MTTNMLEYELRSAILSTGLLQPVSSKKTAKSISILCRGVPGQDKIWLREMEELLGKFPDDSLHVCKKFVSKDGKMVFGWHIGVDSTSPKSLKKSVQWLCEYLATFKPSLVSEPVTAVAPHAPEPPRAQPEVPNILKGMPPPRAPGPPGMESQPPPPTLYKFEKKTLSKKTDGKGKVTLTEEVPLPHVYRELNRPTEKDRGAKYLGDNG